MFFRRFQFLDPGPLVDGELTLVAPSRKLVDELLHAELESGLIGAGLEDINAARARQEAFLRECPAGRQKADLLAGRVPAYHFWMRLDPEHPVSRTIPIRIVGGIGFRVGRNRELEFYSGHIGYHVYPPARGHHYAERAVRLLLPLVRHHRIDPLWITVNPDNTPSRRTCERLGAELVDVVQIPEGHPFRERGETSKCRYRIRGS